VGVRRLLEVAEAAEVLLHLVGLVSLAAPASSVGTHGEDRDARIVAGVECGEDRRGEIHGVTTQALSTRP
jgi:hypothetical protein